MQSEDLHPIATETDNVTDVSSTNSIYVCRPRGLGDVLMCTPALRELKRINPSYEVHFYTNYPDVVRGLPYIDHISTTQHRPSHTIWMRYEHATFPSRHLAELLGESIGICVSDVRPDCAVNNELVQRYQNEWKHLPRPHILVQRRASTWFSNKDWPVDYWDKLIMSLLQSCTVIEIGLICLDSPVLHLPNYIDLRGNSREELIANIAAADILIAPDSGPVHIAAAVQTPAVVIMGGIILPENTAYDGNKILYTPMPCSPCWLREPCPINRECLRNITPEMVEQAVREIWQEKRESRVYPHMT